MILERTLMATFLYAVKVILSIVFLIIRIFYAWLFYGFPLFNFMGTPYCAMKFNSILLLRHFFITFIKQAL
jgi:hypothetical protein